MSSTTPSLLETLSQLESFVNMIEKEVLLSMLFFTKKEDSEKGLHIYCICIKLRFSYLILYLLVPSELVIFTNLGRFLGRFRRIRTTSS